MELFTTQTTMAGNDKVHLETTLPVNCLQVQAESSYNKGAIKFLRLISSKTSFMKSPTT